MGKNNKNGQGDAHQKGRTLGIELVKKAIAVLDYVAVPVDEKLKKVKELLEKAIEK